MTKHYIAASYTDGVRRAAPCVFPIDIPTTEKPDAALRRYFDRPRPANDNRRVYRSIKSAAPYDNICSTRWKYVDVSVPRVSILDGAPNACRRTA